MDKVYIETSIVSHAAAWPSRDVAIAGLQQQARDWWTNERHKFDLVTSQLTLDEAADGDPVAAADRLRLLQDMPLVDINSHVEALAERLLRGPRDASKGCRRRGAYCRSGCWRRGLSADAELQAYSQCPRIAANLQATG